MFVVGIPLAILAFHGLLAATPGTERLGRPGRLATSVAAAGILGVVGLLVTRRGAVADLFAKAFRDDYAAKMRDRAKELANAGEAINPRRIHWFLTTAEGFTEVTEVTRVSPLGISSYEYRESGGPWSLIDDVVATPSHVFLVRGQEAWVIPGRCFSDSHAMQRFVDVVNACRQAVSRAPVGHIAQKPDDPEAVQIKHSPPA
jgi:hypothetical protein